MFIICLQIFFCFKSYTLKVTMNPGSEDSEKCMDVWNWKLRVFYFYLKLWQLKRSIDKCAIARRRRPLGRKWTRNHNSQENREIHSWYNTILKEAAPSDSYVFLNMTRMTPTTFEKLLNRPLFSLLRMGHFSTHSMKSSVFSFVHFFFFELYGI